MCGHRFETPEGSGADAAVVCPACGTTLAGDGPASIVGREAVQRKVQPPAVCLIVVGAMMILGGCLGAVSVVTGPMINPGGGAMPADQAVPPEREAGRVIGQTVGALIGPIFGIAVILGGIKMYRLESRGSVMLASVLAMLPCSLCCLFGLPVGIWSLVVLSDPAVKAAFR